MHDPIGEYSSEATTSSPPLHPLHPVASTVDVANWVETAAMPASGYNGSGGVYGGQPPLSRSKGKAAVKKMQPAAQRKWLVFDKRGDTSVMTSYKNEVAQQMGIQLRDLRCVLVAILCVVWVDGCVNACAEAGGFDACTSFTKESASI
jgi:hypothetical protein